MTRETSSLKTLRRWGIQTGKRWVPKRARISSNPCQREAGSGTLEATVV
jgi:hypothetical protein